MSDVDVLNLALNGDSDSIEYLSNQHSGLYCKIINRYVPAAEVSGLCINDLYEDRMYVLGESLRTFNPEKQVKFTTHFANMTRYHVLRSIEKNNRCVQTLDVQSPEDWERICEENSYYQANADSYPSLEDYDKTEKDIQDVLVERDEKLWFVIKNRFLSEDCDTYRALGQKLHISSQGAQQMTRRALKILKKTLTK